MLRSYEDNIRQFATIYALGGSVPAPDVGYQLTSSLAVHDVDHT